VHFVSFPQNQSRHDLLTIALLKLGTLLVTSCWTGMKAKSCTEIQNTSKLPKLVLVQLVQYCGRRWQKSAIQDQANKDFGDFMGSR